MFILTLLPMKSDVFSKGRLFRKQTSLGAVLELQVSPWGLQIEVRVSWFGRVRTLGSHEMEKAPTLLGDCTSESRPSGKSACEKSDLGEESDRVEEFGLEIPPAYCCFEHIRHYHVHAVFRSVLCGKRAATLSEEMHQYREVLFFTGWLQPSRFLCACATCEARRAGKRWRREIRRSPTASCGALLERGVYSAGFLRKNLIAKESTRSPS